MPQDLPQCPGKGITDLRMDLDLGDAIDVVFHRVLDGDDIDVLVDDFF